MQILKLLSILLEYPDQDLIDNVPEIHARIDKSRDIDATEKKALHEFVDYLTSKALTDLQVEYVKTFDSTPEHSLHLTHHLFGDESDRNRGPALIDLSEMYKEYGVEMSTNELPDYLPLILEFAAQMEDNEAMVFLSDVNKVLAALTANLTKAGSPYATPLSIIESRATLTRLAA